MALANTLRAFPWLQRHSLPIAVKGDNVEVLYHPQDFFKTLKKEILNAKHRILISSLYVGTGNLEKELLSDMHCALSRNPTLRCTLLLDYFRNHRGNPNTVTTLLESPLPRCRGNRFRLHLYHTPQLRGLAKRLIPERFNELVGLQHTKLFICDDNVVLSGANLSHDYFTMRQDRYLAFRDSPRLAAFFAAFHRILCRYSYRVHADGSTSAPSALGIDPFTSQEILLNYKDSFSDAVAEFLDMSRSKTWVEPVALGDHHRWARSYAETTSYGHSDHGTRGGNVSGSDLGGRHRRSRVHRGLSRLPRNQPRPPATPEVAPDEEGEEDCDTIIYPLLQLGLYNIIQDELATRELLRRVEPGERVFLASGYFNLPPQYLRAILASKGEYIVLAASPQAVGFFTATGIARHIPYLYAKFADDFLRRVRRRRQQERIRYREYERKGWTFHGKGLWYYNRGELLPSLTLVGSSNYGHRSLRKDLEAQIALVTTNDSLRQALHEEQKLLYSYGNPLPEGGRSDPPPTWVRIVSRALRRHA